MMSNKQRNLDSELIRAADVGCVDVVKRLLEEGANVHAENEYALECAAEGNYLKIMEILLEAGASPQTNPTILEYAYDEGNSSVIKILEEHIKRSKKMAVVEGIQVVYRTTDSQEFTEQKSAKTHQAELNDYLDLDRLEPLRAKANNHFQVSDEDLLAWLKDSKEAILRILSREVD